MNAHIVKKTVLQINEQELCAVKKRQKEKGEPQFFRDTGVHNPDEDNGKEQNR
jgi:hypothetical protein